MNARCLPYDELCAIWQKNGWGKPEELPKPLIDHCLVYCGKYCWHSLTHSRSPFELRMILEQRVGRIERNVRR